MRALTRCFAPPSPALRERDALGRVWCRRTLPDRRADQIEHDVPAGNDGFIRNAQDAVTVFAQPIVAKDRPLFGVLHNSPEPGQHRQILPRAVGDSRCQARP
jgi:hypothetical protein